MLSATRGQDSSWVVGLKPGSGTEMKNTAPQSPRDGEFRTWGLKEASPPRGGAQKLPLRAPFAARLPWKQGICPHGDQRELWTIVLSY